MLIKFETKSNRVKGLAFHPRRPWVLASLHTGVIQLWDYRMQTQLERFDEHEGPVRGVHFHNTQPIFVSGGDDYKIKVWNYNNKRCLFTLLGHIDYIRTVQFHYEQPWIVSASDDQTIRIWNWQSRTCIAVLGGHNHYVMCASFHPRDDLLVSASLDQTIRVWDVANLKRKTPSTEQQSSLDLIGGGDAMVKYVLEGHEKGVNWASFHPTLPFIVSGADDRHIKLWRMNDNKAWEVDTLRGHINNVSCVMFHGQQPDTIISNSEDRSLRVWDMTKRISKQNYKREGDRFWILAIHSEVNLLAAGHDNGMIIFKLERERPALVCHGNQLFYIKDKFVRLYDVNTQRDNGILSVRRLSLGQGFSCYRQLHYNPYENVLVVTSDGEGGQYEMFQLPKEIYKDTVSEGKRGSGMYLSFVTRNRLAVLDKASNQILIKNMANEVTKKVPLTVPGVEAMYSAPQGNVMLITDDKAILYDIQQRLTIAQTGITTVKNVLWSPDSNYVALVSKFSVLMCDKKLSRTHQVHELSQIQVKSGVWDSIGVFIYTTHNHLKYVLPNGDSGIIKTMDQPAYLVKVENGVVNCIFRNHKIKSFKIDDIEYRFKLALFNQQYSEVVRLIKNYKLIGKSLISYLQERGYPQVALHLVQYDQMRFDLAIKCGNLEVALESAQEIDNKETWNRLGQEALRYGNVKIVENCFQKTRNFERLTFMYLILGDLVKFEKMMKIAQMRNDVMGRFQDAMYIGDVKERAKILLDAEQVPLAYMTAKLHGLEEEAQQIVEKLGYEPDEILEDDPDEDGVQQGPLLMQPPTPILKEKNWPLLEIKSSKGGKGDLVDFLGDKADYNDVSHVTPKANGLNIYGEPEEGFEEDNQEQFEDVENEEAEVGAEDEDMELGDEDGGWEQDELELPPELQGQVQEKQATSTFVAPSSGVSIESTWITNSSLAPQHIAAGSLPTAFRILKRQLGIVNFDNLRGVVQDLYKSSFCSINISPMPTANLEYGLDRLNKTARQPTTCFSLQSQLDRFEDAAKFITKGKFTDALNILTQILYVIPFIVVDTSQQADQVKELLVQVRDNHTALRIEGERKKNRESNPQRSTELGAYFTHQSLRKEHLVLGLKQMYNQCYKLQCFNLCQSFIRRFLEFQISEQDSTRARQVLGICQKKNTDAFTINYDPHSPFDVCPLTFTPIYRGQQFVQCPYTQAKFQPQCKGQISPFGNIAQVGAESSGLQNLSSA